MSTTTTLAAANPSSRSRFSSPRCVPFAFRRGTAGERRARALPPPATPPPPAHPAGTGGGCGRPLCRAAEVVGGGVRDAFFTSLDRCSCVEVGTMSFKEAEVPLMMPPPDGAAGAGRRVPSSSSASAGKTRGGGGGGGGGSSRRRGLGCCSANSTSDN